MGKSQCQEIMLLQFCYIINLLALVVILMHLLLVRPMFTRDFQRTNPSGVFYVKTSQAFDRSRVMMLLFKGFRVSRLSLICKRTVMFHTK